MHLFSLLRKKFLPCYASFPPSSTARAPLPARTFPQDQFFTAGRIVASSDLITVLPHHLIAATGMQEALVVKELPFDTPEEHVDMLWHERDDRSPAHKWLRAHLSATTSDEFDRIARPVVA